MRRTYQVDYLGGTSRHLSDSQRFAVVCLDYTQNKRIVMAMGLTEQEANQRVEHLKEWFRKRYPKGELIPA